MSETQKRGAVRRALAEVLAAYGVPASVLRLAALALVVAAVSGLFAVWLPRPAEYVLVLDASASMRRRFPGLADAVASAWKSRFGPDAAVVVAGEHPRPPGTVAPAAGPEGLTDLPAALTAASALFSGRADKRLLLVTDGITAPEALPAARRTLRERGVSVSALMLPQPLRQAGVLDAAAPGRVFPWEAFTVKGRVAASSPGAVTVLLRREGQVVAEKEVVIDRTRVGQVEFLQEAQALGRLRYSLEVKGPRASPRPLAVEVAASPRVLYVTVDPESARPLVGLLRDAGVVVNVVEAAGLYQGGDDLAQADAVVLDDVPLPALPDDFQERLGAAVARGSGLLVLGGRKGLGSGEYRDSPLESLLPVTVGFESPPPPAASAIVLALDTSASMNLRPMWEKQFFTDSPRKIDVARDAALEVAKVLRPDDRIGILGNSTDIFWIFPLGEPRDRDELLARIAGIKPDGEGINFYSVVREAFRALQAERAAVRHVMVLCDAGDIDQYEVLGEGHAHDMIARFAGEGLTLSILAIGHSTDKDVPFLRNAALLGKGDLYVISNLVALPRYFVGEYRKMTSRFFLEEEVATVSGDYSDLLQGQEGRLPALAGVSAVTERQGSRSPVRTVQGMPVVTLGRFGKGRTAVFASDNGSRWARPWLEWSFGRRFWLGLLFSVAPGDRGREGADVVLRAGPGERGFSLAYSPLDGGFPPWEELSLGLGGEGAAEGAPVRLPRTGLRTFRSSGSLPPAGLYRYALSAEGRGEVAAGEVLVPPSDEETPFPEDRILVNAIVTETGGRWLKSPEELKEREKPAVPARQAALLLLGLATILLVLEALLQYRGR